MRLTATFNYIKWRYLADRRMADPIQSFLMVSVSLCHLGNFFFWKFGRLISHLNLTILISGKTLFPLLNLVLGISERHLGYTWVRFSSPRVATKCNTLLQHRKSDQHLCTQFFNYFCIFIYFTMVTNNVEEHNQ